MKKPSESKHTESCTALRHAVTIPGGSGGDSNREGRIIWSDIRNIAMMMQFLKLGAKDGKEDYGGAVN